MTVRTSFVFIHSINLYKVYSEGFIKLLFNVCFIKIRSKHNNNTLLSLLWIFMKQTLTMKLPYCKKRTHFSSLWMWPKLGLIIVMKTLGSNGVIKFLIPILSFPQLHFWTTYDAVKKLLNLHTQTEASVTVFRLIHAFIQILILTRYMKRQQIDALMGQTAFFC